MKFSCVAISIPLVALFASVQAQTSGGLQVIFPGGPDQWWVSNADNNVIWTCQTSPYNNFTVVLANQDTTKWQNFPLLAVETNYDCSKEFTPQQLSTPPPDTGYLIQLVNDLNETDIYAQSQPFEIKAANSPYPSTTEFPSASSTGASATGSATGSGSASSAQNTGTSGKSNDASKTSAATLVAAAAAALGLFLA